MFSYKREEPTVCIVCYDTKYKLFRTLQCGHKFHRICIKQWLDNHNYCPLCRKRTEKHRDEKPRLIEPRADIDLTEYYIYLSGNTM